MHRTVAVLTVSAALVACSSDTFATADDGGVDAPVATDGSGPDVPDVAVPSDASDAAVDAPAKTWCQSFTVPPALCADFEQGDLVSGFASGQPATFPSPSAQQGTATLVAGKSGVGGLQLEGAAPNAQPVNVGLALPLGTTSKQEFIFSFALKVDVIDTSSTVPQFFANVNIALNCSLALRVIPSTHEIVVTPGFPGPPSINSGLILPSSAWSHLTLTTTVTPTTLAAKLEVDGLPFFQKSWSGATCLTPSAPTFNLALHADPVVTKTRLVFDEVFVRAS